MADEQLLHEEAMVKACIVKERRERWLELLKSSKHRHKITESLAHPHPAWFDARYVKKILPSQSHAAGIYETLRAKGAGTTYWAISEAARVDGRELDLKSALSEIVGSQIRTILSCVPGKLAYLDSEDGRFILERTSSPS